MNLPATTCRFISYTLVLIFCAAGLFAADPLPPAGSPPGAPPAGGPGGPGGPGSQSTSTKVSCTEGDWSFDLITTTSGDQPGTAAGVTKTSTITYYAGKTASIVAIPSVLGGAPVTRIASQAFGHHGEIAAVYVPDSVITVEDWAFYDLNAALVISFANPKVAIDAGAFQSSGNAVLYLPASSTIKTAGGKAVVNNATAALGLTLQNADSAAIAGGSYLNVTSAGPYQLTLDLIKAMAKPASGLASDMVNKGSTLAFSGPAYEPKAQVASIFKDFQAILAAADLNKTFRSLTASEAAALNKQTAADSAWSVVKSLLNFQSGYYLNGNPVRLDAAALAFDAKTGAAISQDAGRGLFPSTGSGYYKSVAARDTDNDGDIDGLYYSPYALTYSYNTVSISSSLADLNGLKARDVMNPVYLAFANAVLAARGEGVVKSVDKLDADTAKSGSALDAAANQERSLLWADDYGVAQAGVVHGESRSVGNWAKISKEVGLAAYNVEIIMEWGMNALLYATNGGVVRVGTLGGERSTFYANGDGANGIVAGGAGTKAGTAQAPSSTASAYLYNADLTLEGWNNHVADVVYGGYAWLEDIKATTGKAGSYAVGQASALANDFGNGVVEAKDFHAVTYGNRSAGIYVIGGGVISAQDSSFESRMDAGLVIASGGHLKISNSTAAGQIGLRNRGGISTDSTSTLSGTTLKIQRDLSGYVTGSKAAAAVHAWKSACGSADLLHAYMSDASMTLGRLCTNYGISQEKKTALYAALGKIAGTAYGDQTPLRNSVLDNTFYNYSAGAFTGSTDFAEVPYLTVGSSFGGLVGSALEFEAAGVTLDLKDMKVEYTSAGDFRYLAASEAGSAPVIRISNSTVQGLVWNEGKVNRVVEGRPGDRSSSLDISFEGSSFAGAFADGSNGLWNVAGLSYTDASGAKTSRNGNYWGAQANWGITARFDKASSWTVSSDSYLGTLVIESGAKIQAPAGKTLVLTVNGKVVPLQAGTYSGQVVLNLK